MEELPYDTDEPVAALATPWGESAIAVIRSAGTDCIERVAKVFSKPEKLRAAESGTMMYGLIRDPISGQSVDQVVAGIFRPPHGYTGQESVEISCHGSLPGIQRILDVLRSAGFRDAAAGEFTLRAFLNGKLDLTRAEAVGEIVQAKSERAQGLALERLSGSVMRRIEEVKQRLADLLTTLELQLDYPDEEIDTPPEIDPSELEREKKRIDELAAGYKKGRIYQEGVTVAITGPTNAGKSSLFNLFLREDRSIVSEVHGTTRDYIESWISVKGIPVRLVDTAGLRDAEHPVEKEGIRRSEQLTESASLVLYLIDGTVGATEEQRKFIAEQSRDDRYLFIHNKADLIARPDNRRFSVSAVNFPVSAVTGEGFEELEEEMGRRLLGAGSSEESLYIDSKRQYELLLRASDALQKVLDGFASSVPVDFVATDLGEAVNALGEITGEVTSADILNRIFSNFCVGK